MNTVSHTSKSAATLGLFLGGGRLAYAVVRAGAVEAQDCVPFALDPGRDEAEVIAAKLREVLASARISARNCRLALPLNWVVGSRFSSVGLPPEALVATAALELERQCGAPVPAAGLLCQPPDAAGQVLAVAVEPGVARQLAEACRLAGLRLEALLPAVAGALPLETVGTEVDILPLPEQMDALVRRQGRPAVLRQLALYRDSSGPHLDECLTTAMRNLLVTLSAFSGEEAERVSVRVLGTGQLAEGLTARIRERAEWQCVPAQPGGHQPAVQAALMAARHPGFGDDALCLVPPERERSSRWWATRAGRPLVAAGVALALAGLAFGGAFLARRLEIRRLEDGLARLADQRREAEELRDELRSTAPWFRQEPERLTVLLVVAEAFPERGTVWVTDLAIEPDGTVSLTGCARDQNSLFQVTEALGKRTRNLGVLRTRQGTKTGDPMTFSISFSLPSATRSGGA